MIKIICTGKNKDKALSILEQDYCRRISGMEKIQLEEVKDEPIPATGRAGDENRVKEEEGKRILSRISDSDYVILLDLHGTMLDTMKFHEKRVQLKNSSRPVKFVIAGSLGPSKAMVERADFRWKLSDLTFTHLMTRILVLEQIYRSLMIENHRTYHK